MPGHVSEPVGPVDGRKVPRYAGAGSFGRLPEIDRVADYDVAVLGAPFDSGTSYRPGARFGPMAVRQASRHLRPGHHVELDTSPFTAIQVVDAGDVPVTPFSIDEAMGQSAEHAAELLQGDRKVIAIGGDHTIALPMLRSVARAHGPVALVHFDAHLDTWDTYFNAPTTHGTIFRRAFEENLLVEDHSIHVGIRGPIYARHRDAGGRRAVQPRTAARAAGPDQPQPGQRRPGRGGPGLRPRRDHRDRRRDGDLRHHRLAGQAGMTCDGLSRGRLR
jgi:agmatinase